MHFFKLLIAGQKWGRVFFIFIVIAGTARVPVKLLAQENRTFTVKGQILSLTDELPISGIEVVLSGTEFKIRTDSLGMFRFTGVPRGVYDIVAKYPDFEATILKNVAIPPATKKDYIFSLTSNDHPLPYADAGENGDMALLKGSVSATIDTFKTYFRDGRLLLRANPVGNLTQAYLYPRYFEILPVAEQNFRFQFYLPRGQKYHLYLIWQLEKKNFVFEQILDVARDELNPDQAKIFNLITNEQMANIRFSLVTNKLQSK